MSVWRKVGGECLPDCICPPSKCKFKLNGMGVYYHGVGIKCVVDGEINAEKYISVLEDNLWPVIV